MKYKVAKSKIPNADKGLFAKNKLDRGERIGLAHRDGQPVGTIGNMHNHSDNPNMRSIKVGNERYVYAIRDIEPGEELTTDYRMQPELEQPEDFMRKGGRTRGLVAMPKPSKKGLASKKYSRSLEATNILFAQNPLFKKPKSKRNKIFNPNAKYYQGGGYVDLELDDTQIAQYVKGGYIVEEVNDPSVPTLNRYDNGGDTKPGVQDLPETTVYDPKTKKTQASLFRQLSDAKDAYQNFTEQNKGKKFRLNIADASSSIEDLRKGIQLYKDELRKEREETQAELKRLENLKSKAAFKDNKDIQNLKLKDLNTTKGRMKILDAIRSSNLSGDQVAAIYKGYGLDIVDPNVKSGKGPNAAYSAKETEAAAMKNVPEFVDMVSNVATAIPLIGAAGALAPAAGATLSNPIVQGAMAAPSIAEMALHPQDTITGIATTGVEAYDKLMGDEDDVNRFGNPYWQDMDDVLNAVMLIPGIKSIGAARNFLKTPTGFNFAKNYIKPVKDVYKGAVKTIKQKTAPIFDTNIPKTAASTVDMLTGGRGATEVVNTAGAVLKNAPAWAEPTVGNVLKSFTLASATGQAIDGVSNVTKGFSEGDKEKFDQGFAEATDAVTTLAQVSNIPELSNVTTPLVMLTTANEIKDNVKKDEKGEAAFNLLRFVNQTRSLPISRTQILPTKTVRAFKHIKPKHIKPNIKKIQKGGIVTTMSKAEIDDYIKRGYIVEELD